MNNFDKAYKDSYFSYHHRPIPVHTLDARMFIARDGLDPVLNEATQKHILYDIQAINELEAIGNRTRVLDYVMVGPVLEKNANNNCNIYIIVQLNTANLQDVLKERILNFTTKNLSSSKMNQRLLTGTSHPLHYKVSIRKIDLNDYPAAFHPFTNMWLKQPLILGK